MTKQAYQRIDLAIEQVDLTLELFIKRRSFVAALTLASVAEEILGKTLSLRGERTTLEHEHSVIGPVEQLLRNKPYSWKEFLLEKNRVRNAAKHMSSGSASILTADLEDEALWMLIRACDNYIRLGLRPTPNMAEFDDWFSANVVGLEDGR